MKRFIFIPLSVSLITLVLTTYSLSGDVSMTNNSKATLYFSSFDGGGPDFSINLQDTSFVSYVREKQYNKPDHDIIDGAGFKIIYTFTGLKEGETILTVNERSPIADNTDITYSIKVDKNLNVEITLLKTEEVR